MKLISKTGVLTMLVGAMSLLSSCGELSPSTVKFSLPPVIENGISLFFDCNGERVYVFGKFVPVTAGSYRIGSSILCGQDWTMTKDCGWISASPMEGIAMKETDITFTLQNNTTNAERVCTFTVTLEDGATQSFKVLQYPFPGYTTR